MRLTKNIIITQPTAAYGVLTRGTHKAEFATNRSHSFDTSNRTKSPMQQWSKCSVRGRNLPGNFQWDLRKYWQTNGRHVGTEASADTAAAVDNQRRNTITTLTDEMALPCSLRIGFLPRYVKNLFYWSDRGERSDLLEPTDIASINTLAIGYKCRDTNVMGTTVS